MRALPPEEPVTMDDFCACARGREARRWFGEGQRAWSAILEVVAERDVPCHACDDRGVLWYGGWAWTDPAGVQHGEGEIRLDQGSGSCWYSRPFSPPWCRGEEVARLAVFTMIEPL
jgi:hypothetical protein